MPKSVIRPGLDRIRRVLARLGHPEDRFAAVIVGGTNGKGSVCSLLESTFRTAGFATGLFTSPHLLRVQERVRLNGLPLDAARWLKLERRVTSVARGSLSEYEIHTAMAFLAFAEGPVDIAILEVGLGGRWDATNAHPAPEATVTTSIGMDHTEWLGKTLPKIYAEKREIARHGTPHLQNISRSLWASGDRWAAERGARFFNLGRDIVWKIQGTTVELSGALGRLPPLSVPWEGHHHRANAALAGSVVLALRRKGWRLPDADVVRGFRCARWPGRFDVVSRRPLVIVDGAHNEPAAAALAKAWTSLHGSQKATLLFGCLRDKDLSGLVRRLAPVVKKVYLVPIKTSRARPVTEMAALWQKHAPTVITQNLENAWELARGESPGPFLVTGSLYLAGTALKKWKGENLFV